MRGGVSAQSFFADLFVCSRVIMSQPIKRKRSELPSGSSSCAAEGASSVIGEDATTSEVAQDSENLEAEIEARMGAIKLEDDGLFPCRVCNTRYPWLCHICHGSISTWICSWCQESFWTTLSLENEWSWDDWNVDDIYAQFCDYTMQRVTAREPRFSR